MLINQKPENQINYDFFRRTCLLVLISLHQTYSQEIQSVQKLCWFQQGIYAILSISSSID